MAASDHLSRQQFEQERRAALTSSFETPEPETKSGGLVRNVLGKVVETAMAMLR